MRRKDRAGERYLSGHLRVTITRCLVSDAAEPAAGGGKLPCRGRRRHGVETRDDACRRGCDSGRSSRCKRCDDPCESHSEPHAPNVGRWHRLSTAWLTRLANADVIAPYMWNPWTFVLCRVFGLHDWEPFAADNDLDSGWRCRDCRERVLKREIVEGDYEADVKSPYWGRSQHPPGGPKI